MRISTPRHHRMAYAGKVSWTFCPPISAAKCWCDARAFPGLAAIQTTLRRHRGPNIKLASSVPAPRFVRRFGISFGNHRHFVLVYYRAKHIKSLRPKSVPFLLCNCGCRRGDRISLGGTTGYAINPRAISARIMHCLLPFPTNATATGVTPPVLSSVQLSRSPGRCRARRHHAALNRFSCPVDQSMPAGRWPAARFRQRPRSPCSDAIVARKKMAVCHPRLPHHNRCP